MTTTHLGAKTSQEQGGNLVRVITFAKRFGVIAAFRIMQRITIAIGENDLIIFDDIKCLRHGTGKAAARALRACAVLAALSGVQSGNRGQSAPNA